MFAWPNPIRVAVLFVSMSICVGDSTNATKPPVVDITFAPDGKSLLAVSQLGLQEFAWPSLELKRTIHSAAAANLHCVRYSPNGNRVAIAGGIPSEEGTVEVYSWPLAKLIAKIVEHEDCATDLAWLDNTKLYSCGLDRQIQLLDIPSGTSVRKSSGHSRGVTGLCLLRKDTSQLVSVGIDQSVRTWDLSSGKSLRSLNQHTKSISCIAAAPPTTGLPQVATAADDRTIRFWQPTIGRMVRYIRLKASPIDLAWTIDGQLLAAACKDGHVRIVDPVEVTVILDRPMIDGWAYAVAVHRDNKSVVVGGSDGQIRRLELPDRGE